MIVVVKSGPDTTDGRRGVAIAHNQQAGLVLVQDAVEFARRGAAGSAGAGAIHVLEDDLRLRGLRGGDLDERVLRVGYAELVELLAADDNVVGAF